LPDQCRCWKGRWLLQCCQDRFFVGLLMVRVNGVSAVGRLTLVELIGLEHSFQGCRNPSERLQERFVVEGELEKAVTAMNVQLMADVQAMVLNGAHTDAQDIGNFLAGAIFGDKF